MKRKAQNKSKNQQRQRQRNAEKNRETKISANNSLLRDGNTFFSKEFPDRCQATLKFCPAVIAVFASASMYNGATYYMNSIANFGSGLIAGYEYQSMFAIPYNKYRVVKQVVTFVFTTKEAFPCSIVVAPAIGSGAVSSQATYETIASLPFAKRVDLGPKDGGANQRMVKFTIHPEKLIGPHYLTQDEYAAAPGSDPATLVYWQLGGNNGNNFTTGGVQLSMMFTTTVQFYELERDSSITSKRTVLSALKKLADPDLSQVEDEVIKRKIFLKRQSSLTSLHKTD